MVVFREARYRLEEFLATDTLFIEYFNTFLALPTFPQPLTFNAETGGFELLSSAKDDVIKKIREAIRSSRRQLPLYKVVKHHAFTPLPQIPMEYISGPKMQEIDTTFTVTTMNKEQGIEWIKTNRLPAFMKSDCYAEYRLSKLLSQVKLVNSKVEPELFMLAIDFSPIAAAAKMKKKVEEDEKKKEDPRKKLNRDMYIDNGEATEEDLKSWYETAQEQIHGKRRVSDDGQGGQQAELTRAKHRNTRPQTAAPVTSTGRKGPLADKMPGIHSRPTSAALSQLSGRADSGFWTPARVPYHGSTLSALSDYGSVASAELQQRTLPTDTDNQSRAEERRRVQSAQPKRPERPKTPRANDTICFFNEERPATRMKYTPPPDSAYHDIGIPPEHSDEEATGKGPIPGTEFEPASAGDQTDDEANPDDVLPPIAFDDVNDLSGVVAGTVLKHAMAAITTHPASEFEKHPGVSSLCPSRETSRLSMADLERVMVDPNIIRSSSPTQSKEDGNGEVAATESDGDESIFESDHEYEGPDRIFAKPKKSKKSSLCNIRGISVFREFLKGTVGERLFEFWLDIDRGRFFELNENTSKYTALLREQYHKQGAPLELPIELQKRLDLIEPSKWVMEKLLSIQRQIAEPLVHYWVPRFLLHQELQPDLEKYSEYKQHRDMNKPKSVDETQELMVVAKPIPKTLPLRPKTCLPRPKNTDVTPWLEQTFPEHKQPLTSLPVGQRRPIPPLRPKTAPALANIRKNRLLKMKEKEMKKEEISNQRDEKPIDKEIEDTADQSSTVNGKPNGESDSQQGKQSDVKDIESQHGSRPSSARSISSIRSTESEFLGGRRMEGLLQALRSEGPSGHFLRRYIAQSGNRIWMSCLAFWTDLQHYHKLFYHQNWHDATALKKSQYLFSQYIMPHSAGFINCDQSVYRQIQSQLTPPYEELFDNAEEHAIQVLFTPWTGMNEADQMGYKKIQLIEEKRRIQTKSKIVVKLQRRGLIRESLEPEEDPMEGYADPVYDPTLMERIPEDFREFTLDVLVHNRLELEHFKEFLQENFAGMDLMCWMDIESWKRIPHADEKRRNAKAADIKTKYLNKKYFFGPNSPAGREGQNKVMEVGGGWGKLLDDVPPTPTLLEMQRYVGMRLEKKWLPQFLATAEFASRQKPKQHMEDAAEDLVMQRKRRQQQVWKMLETKWASSSKEVISFRRALMNPVTSAQFKRFVSIKGDSLENDVLFWQEVQKYKGLCHANADDHLVQQKIMAIIHCFIDSSIPPQLQIDIPQEQAERLLERRRELGPYIFREAQLTVFRVLLQHWQDFCDFRSNTADDKVETTLKRQKRFARKQEKLRQKAREEQLEKEAARRKALGLPDDADLDAYHDPFARTDSPDEDEDTSHGHHDNNAISWSYSEYMKSMDEENVLNNVDAATFSSVLDSRPGSGAPVKEQQITGEEVRPTPSRQKSGVRRKSATQRVNDRKTDTSLDQSKSKVASPPRQAGVNGRVAKPPAGGKRGAKV